MFTIEGQRHSKVQTLDQCSMYALFVSLIFDLAMMTMFADDNYVICWNKHLTKLMKEMKETLEFIIK